MRLNNSATGKEQQIIDDNCASIREIENVNPNIEQTGQKRSNSSEKIIVSTKKRNTAKPEDSDRYDLLGHFPEINRNLRARCKNETCNLKTSVFCIKCKVHLCLIDGRNCFKNFHIKKSEEM